MNNDWLCCPHCTFEGEPCDFPDLYYNGCGYVEQEKLQEEIQSKGYNIVTCGMCGYTIIHRVGEE